MGIAVCMSLRAGPSAQEVRQPDTGLAVQPIERPTLAAAQSLFYNGRYEEAAALALSLRATEPAGPASDELRSSALLFQLKALLEGRTKKADALRTCTPCPD